MADRQFKVAQGDTPTAGKFAPTVILTDEDGDSVDVLTGTATAQVNSTATDVAGLVTNFNALLAKLRTRGVLAP